MKIWFINYLIYDSMICRSSSLYVIIIGKWMLARAGKKICTIFPCYRFLYNYFVMNCFTVEDVSDLWPTVKNSFEERLPFKRACLNNKTRNPVFVENLPAEFILTTDARLRSRFPQEQYLFWFREPYATLVLVTCEVHTISYMICIQYFCIRWKILLDRFQTEITKKSALFLLLKNMNKLKKTNKFSDS